MNEALVLLVLVWALLLVPGALRSRNASPHATVGGFERAMDVLRSESRGTAGGRQVMVPGDAGRIVQRAADGTPSRRVMRPRTADPVVARRRAWFLRPRTADPVVARRRAWFLRCLAATGITLAIALIAGGGWLWLPFAVSVVITGGYIALLRHLKLQRDEARQVVRDLELRPEEPEQTRDVAAAGGGQWVGSGTVRLRRWDD